VPASSLSTPETVQAKTTVFSWFKPNRRQEIRQDRKHLEVRARRLLKNYLSADGSQKQQYYEAIAGAAAACQPSIADSDLENAQLNRAAAQAALNVVIARERRTTDDNDQLAELITDAYATVAIAYQRASTAYTADKEMQKLGTAAVHLVTIATSYMTARSKDIA
jgi:serine/threonine protein kinase HipA of HipAB toxin-antitoxin module